MPSIDPKLSAMLTICVILSTLAVITVFKAQQPEELACLRNRFPEVFVRDSAQKGIETSFSFGVMSGRDLRRMELKFFMFYEEPPTYNEKGWTPGNETTLEEVVSRIPAIADLCSAVSSLGGEYEVLERQVELDGVSYEAMQYDFSSFLGTFNDDRTLSCHVSIYMVLKKGTSIRCFQGRNGFFLDQEGTIQYLSISVDENRTEYYPSKMGAAPPGILRYDDFHRNQKVAVIYEVLADDSVLPEAPPIAGRSLLQVVKGYADGSLALFLVNPIPMG